MDREYARLVLAEQSKRDKRPAIDRLVDPLFPQQAGFVTDPNDYITALCTRRAGKSHGQALRLFRAAHRHPGQLSVYMALTRDSAENIMWPAIQFVNSAYRIGAKLTQSNLSVTFQNKSRIKLYGADQKNFIERLRGPKYAEAQIDEAQAFRAHLDMLVKDILQPALGDLRGALVLTGTPGPIPSGLFFDATEGTIRTSRHRWSIYDNPYFPDPYGFVAKRKAENGWTDLNPTYQREYLGKWVKDPDALVYKFDEERNFYDSLPASIPFERVLAIDYGWNDQTAFAIVAYSAQSPHVFIEHAEGHSEMVPSDIAERLKQLISTFRPHTLVADTGGLGKSITEEFIRRHHLAIEPAEKRDKLTFITLMNGDFIDGRCFVHRSLKNLAGQYQTLTKAERPTPSQYEDPRLPNDLCDAALYAYRKARHYMGHAPKTFKNKEEEWKEKEREMERKEVESFHAQESTPWWMK